MNGLISINDYVINDIPEYYLLFLQDMFPYFEKYNATEYLKPLTKRIEYIMMEYKPGGSCDKALLLDKKQNDAANAIKKAFRLREEYSDLGTVAQHDTLQQTVTLANMMIQSGEYQKATNLIEFCETIILDYSDIKSFDYGICQFLCGIMAYQQGSSIPAEKSDKRQSMLLLRVFECFY